MHRRFNHPPELPATDLNHPETHLASVMVKEFRKFSQDNGRLVLGEFELETENKEGLHVMYQCFPSGDFFCWFIENGFFTLIALVDEKIKTLAKMSVAEVVRFQETLQTVIIGMCSKNGYNPEMKKTESEDNDDR